MPIQTQIFTTSQQPITIDFVATRKGNKVYEKLIRPDNQEQLGIVHYEIRGKDLFILEIKKTSKEDYQNIEAALFEQLIKRSFMYGKNGLLNGNANVILFNLGMRLIPQQSKEFAHGLIHKKLKELYTQYKNEKDKTKKNKLKEEIFAYLNEKKNGSYKLIEGAEELARSNLGKSEKDTVTTEEVVENGLFSDFNVELANKIISKQTDDLSWLDEKEMYLPDEIISTKKTELQINDQSIIAELRQELENQHSLIEEKNGSIQKLEHVKFDLEEKQADLKKAHEQYNLLTKTCEIIANLTNLKVRQTLSQNISSLVQNPNNPDLLSEISRMADDLERCEGRLKKYLKKFINYSQERDKHPVLDGEGKFRLNAQKHFTSFSTFISEKVINAFIVDIVSLLKDSALNEANVNLKFREKFEVLFLEINKQINELLKVKNSEESQHPNYLSYLINYAGEIKSLRNAGYVNCEEKDKIEFKENIEPASDEKRKEFLEISTKQEEKELLKMSAKQEEKKPKTLRFGANMEFEESVKSSTEAKLGEVSEEPIAKQEMML